MVAVSLPAGVIDSLSAVGPGSIHPGSASTQPGNAGQTDVAAFQAAIADVQADAPAGPAHGLGGLADHVSSGLQQLSAKLAAWHSPEAVTPPAPATNHVDAAPNTLTAAMTEAVAGLQGSYVFAIQATLASHGSTESTKILNTLLKGQ